jgi:tRNA pseudouridine38-40 synthase
MIGLNQMPRVKLVLEYDGTRYVGWQVQPNGVSVQAVIEEALEKLLGKKTPVLVAGRTDSGVHARGQVIAFDAAQKLPERAYTQGLTGLLPDDVSVVGFEEVPDGFDPRRWAQSKRYVYRVSNRPVHSPLRRLTHWEIFQPLDLAAMREGARHLLGEHDFSSFRASNCEAAHARRKLTRVEITGTVGDEVTLTVEGTAFLKHMVRNITGTLVEVGRGKQRPQWVKQVLEAKDRTQAGQTAPPHGLTLEEVTMGNGPHSKPPQDDDDE